MSLVWPLLFVPRSGLVFATVRARFCAFHRWPDAPAGEHDHLRNKHRHEFHVTVAVSQYHDDRDIEFLAFKDWVAKTVLAVYDGKDMGAKSCEMVAREVAAAVIARVGQDRHVVAEVDEDGENGAVFVQAGEVP